MSVRDDAQQYIDLTLTPPQEAFLHLPCRHPAFVAGFGTGKSQTMAVSAILDAIEGGSGMNIAIAEPTFDLCKLIAVPRIEMMLTDLGIRYKSVANKEISVSSSGVGDFLFRSMDNPARLVGWECYAAHADELDTLKKANAKEVWLQLIARCRQVSKDPAFHDFLPDRPDNRVSAYCTPEGFNFLYGRWGKDKERAAKAGYLMIQAGTHTNPFLPAGYLDALRGSYDEKRFNAYAKGLFVNLTGGSIYHQFDRALNGCDTVIRPGEDLILGQDFNVGKMATVVYVSRWGDDGVEEMHAVDEIHNGLDTPAVIETLKERYMNNGHRIDMYPDASGQNTSSKSASVSDIGLLEDAGITVHTHGHNPRVRDRIISMNMMICDAFGRRRLKVNEKRCPQICECLEQQVYADNGEPDKKAGKDHGNDAAGYPIVYKFPVIRDMLPGSMAVKFNR